MEPSIPVLPLFDLHRGVIELNLAGSWRSFHVSDARAVDRALANAVTAPRWEAATSTLRIHTPSRGNASGRAHTFSLIEFSEARPKAKVGG